MFLAERIWPVHGRGPRRFPICANHACLRRRIGAHLQGLYHPSGASRRRLWGWYIPIAAHTYYPHPAIRKRPCTRKGWNGALQVEVVNGDRMLPDRYTVILGCFCRGLLPLRGMAAVTGGPASRRGQKNPSWHKRSPIGDLLDNCRIVAFARVRTT